MPQATAQNGNANEGAQSQQMQRDFNEFQARAASNSSIQNYDYGGNRNAGRNMAAREVAKVRSADLAEGPAPAGRGG
jgi:hypothetical protein